jgi:hypothetical protein
VEGVDRHVVRPAYGCFEPIPDAWCRQVQAQDQERLRRRRSELERLLDRTILEPTHPELGTCWRFTGTTTPYGRIAKAQDSYTHRLGWKLLRGPIPEDKELHHRCGVYACWNPDHLQMVTHAENLAFKRKMHCKHGHPLSGDNLRTNPRTGARGCRACLRENQRRLRATAGRTQPSDPSSARKTVESDKSGRPRGGPRSVFERLVDRTVLGRCHPELGTCWVFTGPVQCRTTASVSRAPGAAQATKMMTTALPEHRYWASPITLVMLTDPPPPPRSVKRMSAAFCPRRLASCLRWPNSPCSCSSGGVPFVRSAPLLYQPTPHRTGRLGRR